MSPGNFKWNRIHYSELRAACPGAAIRDKFQLLEKLARPSHASACEADLGNRRSRVMPRRRASCGRDVRCGILQLRLHGVWRDVNDLVRYGRGAPPPRDFPLRDASPLHDDDAPRVRGARLLCDDALPLAWTLFPPSVRMCGWSGPTLFVQC
jgi:hypothetical protein